MPMLAAQTSEAEIANLQAVQEVELHAYKTKQAWSAWQLNNVESSWKKLDDAKDTWKTRFLRTQFASCKRTLFGRTGSVATFDISNDFESRELVHRIKAHDVETADHTFTNDGSRLMSGSDDGTIEVLEVKTGIELFEMLESDHRNAFTFHYRTTDQSLFREATKGKPPFERPIQSNCRPLR